MKTSSGERPLRAGNLTCDPGTANDAFEVVKSTIEGEKKLSYAPNLMSAFFSHSMIKM